MDVEHIKLGESAVHLRRAFNWGVVVVGDPATEMPTREGRGNFFAARSSMAVGVRHAADVASDSSDPFEVALKLSVGALHPHSTAEAVLDLPVGEVAVGDADHEELFRIDPGRWHVSILARPSDHPENLEIRLQRVQMQ